MMDVIFDIGLVVYGSIAIYEMDFRIISCTIRILYDYNIILFKF